MKLLDTLLRRNQKEASSLEKEITQLLSQRGGTSRVLADTVAPSVLEISPNYLRIGSKLARTLFVVSYPRYLNTGWFAPVINIDREMDISFFIHPMDTSLILKQIRKRVAHVEAEISDLEERGIVRDPVLETALQDLEDLRDKLVQARERFFHFALYVTLYADTLEDLNVLDEQIRAIMDTKLVKLKSAVYQQDVGFNSTLPIANDILHITTALNSGPLATTFPFVSSTLSMDKGILYGINRENNSLVLFDRFSLENANSVIFAKSGAGKSYAAKLEILRSLMMGTEVLVIDPENEYQHLAETVDGAYVKISLTSPSHINPFDLPPLLAGENPADALRSNIINLGGLLRLMLGGLSTEETAIIDHAISETYASRDITPDKEFADKPVPLMKDLQVVLENMEGGAGLAERLRRYTEGSYSGFVNHPTNINVNRNLVVFNLRDLEEELRPIAMYMVLRYIWNLIRAELKRRLLVVDEAWVLMQHEDGAGFLFGIAKRGRKYYLGLATITQDVNDFINSKYGKAIINNSSLQLLLRQHPAAIDAITKTFNLTDQEKYRLLETGVGQGIFFAGSQHVEIEVVASYTENQIVTTNPAELLKIAQAKEELARESQRG